MKSNNTRPKRRLTPEEMSRKKNALNEIKHLMIRCYPDAQSKRAKKQILNRVSHIFIDEFGSQRDEIRKQIIRRLFDHGPTEKVVLDVNGKKAEFEVVKYAKLRTIDGKSVKNYKNSDLPQYFREGVMAALFKKEVEKRLAAGVAKSQPIIDVTPKKKRPSQKSFSTTFTHNWLRLFQPFRHIMTN